VEQSDDEENIITEPKKVLVLGNGGAASASIKALEIFQCEVFVSGRNNEKTRELASKTGAKTFFFSQVPQKIEIFHLIINTIPVKVPMFDQFSFFPDQYVLDAAYSHPPLREKCISEGANYISGEQWLIHQAIHGFKYFTGKWVNKEKFAEAISIAAPKPGKRRFPSIALTGPMGSGKTTVGKLLAEKLGYEWVDTDRFIETENNMDITDIFRNLGEAYFRNEEKKLLEKLVLRDRIVISCGGGMILDDTNRKLLNDHFHTIFMYVKAGQSIKRIGKTSNRPLLAGTNPAQKAYELLQERLSHYISSSAAIVSTHGGNAQEITELIYEDYRKTFGS
jgi:shikimate kinase